MRNDAAASVLVVEDEGLVAVLLREALTDLGLKPHVFTEGKPALESVAHGSYAAAVLDLGLPDIDGDQIVNALLECDPAFRIVLTTGRDPQEVERRFRSAARVRVLCKPFDLDMLEAELKILGLIASQPCLPHDDYEEARLIA